MNIILIRNIMNKYNKVITARPGTWGSQENELEPQHQNIETKNLSDPPLWAD
jgi:hypothetical protein